MLFFTMQITATKINTNDIDIKFGFVKLFDTNIKNQCLKMKSKLKVKNDIKNQC